MRFDALRRLWERLQSSGGRTLPEDGETYTDSELEFGRLVLPLLEDVDAMKRMLEELSRRARALEVVLDRLPVAALVLDEEGRLLTTNRAARELFGGPAVTSRILEAVRRAVRDGTENEPREVGLPGTKRTLRVVPADPTNAGGGAPSTESPGVVFLVPTDRPPEVDAGSLVNRFGLTKMEAQVVKVVAQGATNKEAADQLGVSIETVRSHLGSAFRKTGASNRASLAALAFGAPFGQGRLPGGEPEELAAPSRA